jgi:hypothetical protein
MNRIKKLADFGNSEAKSLDLYHLSIPLRLPVVPRHKEISNDYRHS